jgi:hypothetical protein
MLAAQRNRQRDVAARLDDVEVQLCATKQNLRRRAAYARS